MEKGNTLPARISTALLLLRIASAMAFLYHGSAILFGSFGGPGPQQLAASHHWPVVMGYLIGLAQLAGGLAVLSGILFRLGAACIVVVMLGAASATRAAFHAPARPSFCEYLGLRILPVLSLRDVRPELLLGNDALQVQFADSLK